MAKSFKDFFGDFNSMRDKLLYAVGDMAQVPQRATLLEPRVNSFALSENPVLASAGRKLLARISAVRDRARSEYDKGQTLISEMLVFKNSVEKNPLYQDFMGGSPSSKVSFVLTAFFDKAKKEDLAFFQSAALKSINFAGRGADALKSLGEASTEVHSIESLAQQVADYAQGKGLLPVISGPEAFPLKKAGMPKTMIAAGLGVAGLLIYFWRKRGK